MYNHKHCRILCFQVYIVSKKIKDGPFKNEISYNLGYDPEIIVQYFEEGTYKNVLLDGKYEKYNFTTLDRRTRSSRIGI